MAPEKQRQTFISYSRVKKNFALKLARELKAAGFPIWLDQLDIPAGARWDDEIEKALRECGIFLIILTPASIASENAKDEIGYAIDHGKRILPVLLEECEIPLRLRRFQYVDFTSMNYDQGVNTAKELLSKLVKEQSLPGTKKVTVNKERPTRPILREAVQAEMERHQIIPDEPGPVSATPHSRRPVAMYAGFAVLTLLVLAGGAMFLRNNLASPGPTPTSEPTRESTPTAIASATTISATHTVEPEQSSVNEFNGDDLSQWTFFRKSGRQDSEFIYAPSNGKLTVEISPNQDQPWAHLIQNTSTYNDVLLELTVTNNGFNNNGVSLICRHSEKGWIEFTVSNNQNYSILVFSSNGDTLQGGSAGSPKIPVGKGTNVYTARCKGNELSLAVNGNHIHTIETNRDLPAGNIGIGFSAPANVAVDLEIESLKVSQP